MSFTPSKEQLSAIQDNEPDYFDGQYSQKQKEGFLVESIRRGKLNVIKLFMEQGVALAPETYAHCLNSLVEKKKKVKVLQYLHSKGVKMTPDSNMGIMRAAIALSVENTQYLAQFVPYDHNGIYLTLNCIVKRDNFSEKELPLVKYEPILNILLQKCSSELLKSVLEVNHPAINGEASSSFL